MATDMTIKQIPPDLMSPRERAHEAAAILADAIVRLCVTRPRDGDIPLGFSAPERVHTNPSQPGVLQ